MAPAGPIFCPRMFMVCNWSHGFSKATFMQEKEKKTPTTAIPFCHKKEVKQFRKISTSNSCSESSKLLASSEHKGMSVQTTWHSMAWLAFPLAYVFLKRVSYFLFVTKTVLSLEILLL